MEKYEDKLKAVSAEVEGLRTGTFKRLVKNPTALIGMIIIGFAVFVGIFAPYLAPYDPFAMSLPRSHEPPSLEHPLELTFLAGIF